jgi:hypothetical protein
MAQYKRFTDDKKGRKTAVGGGIAAPKGKKVVPAGYKNYGQFRSEQVHQRNALRKQTNVRFKRPAKKQRFGKNETVSSAVAQRSGARLAALGGSVKGVDGSDGYTGAEARKIKDARRRQKASKLRYSI